MKRYVIIKADTNDGDYVTSKNEITEELEKVIRKVCKVIKKDQSWGTSEMLEEDNDPQRWVKKGKLTEEEVEIFSYLAPSGEYGIHTIESVEIIEVTKETVLL